MRPGDQETAAEGLPTDLYLNMFVSEQQGGNLKDTTAATYLAVASILEGFVEGTGGQWDWDAYITSMTFDDPYLREVQMRMIHLSDKFPVKKGMGYCGPQGLQVIRDYAKELRHRVAEG
jgi:hypothetical protein